MRELIIKKNNYGPSGETIRLYYEGGVFKPVSSPSSIERAAAEQKAEQMFMTLFDRLTGQGRTFSPSRNSPENYPPKVFAAHPDGKGIGLKAYEGAMERLLNAGTIRIENVGSQNRPRKQSGASMTAADFGATTPRLPGATTSAPNLWSSHTLLLHGKG